jgi:hypothetical protein
VRIHWRQEQPLRRLDDIEGIIARLELPSEIKERALSIFRRLAEVEAKVHGTSVEEVHFHEIGAVDTLVDIIGSVWALDQLNISEISCSSLPWFQGYIQCQHGVVPLPAPATLELLQDKPVYPTELEKELITPTGAVLLDQLVDHFSSGPQGIVDRFGMGWGTYDLGRIPNALRAIICSEEKPHTEEVEKIWVLESNIDHLTGEEIGGLFPIFFEAGALDVLFIPGVMKKNRSGGVIQVLCSDTNLLSIQELFFQQTMTLGIRRQQIERIVLPRKDQSLSSPWGELKAKEVTCGEQSFVKPEYESLNQAAKRAGYSQVQLRYVQFDRLKQR